MIDEKRIYEIEHDLIADTGSVFETSTRGVTMESIAIESMAELAYQEGIATMAEIIREELRKDVKQTD